MTKTKLFNLPNPFRQPPVAFEPIPAENDELLQAIENDDQTHDNLWQLKDAPDPKNLNTFWDEVLQDWNKKQ